MLEDVFPFISGANPALLVIVGLSLTVSLAAVGFATLIGLPIGAAVALMRFPGREAVIVTLNALMGLPPMVVGLAVYLLLSRSGPLRASVRVGIKDVDSSKSRLK